MNRLKKVKKDAYNKLMGTGPKMWARSHFSFLAKSDIMNDIFEAFNGKILEVRDKPIITIIVWIRCDWMTKFAKNEAKSEVYEGKMKPKPKKSLNVEVY